MYSCIVYIFDCRKVGFLVLRISLEMLSTSFHRILIKIQLTVARPFPWEAIIDFEGNYSSVTVIKAVAT